MKPRGVRPLISCTVLPGPAKRRRHKSFHRAAIAAAAHVPNFCEEDVLEVVAAAAAAAETAAAVSFGAGGVARRQAGSSTVHKPLAGPKRAHRRSQPGVGSAPWPRLRSRRGGMSCRGATRETTAFRSPGREQGRQQGMCGVCLLQGTGTREILVRRGCPAAGVAGHRGMHHGPEAKCRALLG